MNIKLTKEEWEFLHRACHHSKQALNVADPDYWNIFNVCFGVSEMAEKIKEKLGSEWVYDV